MEATIAKSADARFAKPEDDAVRKLAALSTVLRAFRDLSPSFPSSYMLAFLEVAMKPGGGSTDYMGALETVQPVMSRILVSLGQKGRNGEEGFDLVETMRDVKDLRRQRTYLTPKGKALLERIEKALEGL